MDIYADLRHEAGATSASVDRPGGASCHDGRSARAPVLLSASSRTGTTFELGESDIYPAAQDLLRAGCPGPTQTAVTGGNSFATGFLPLAAVARRRVEVPLRAAGRFNDGGYGGTWRGHFTLRLQRIERRLVYRYRRVAR